MPARESRFLKFWSETTELPNVDRDFAKLVSTLPKTYAHSLAEVELPPPDRTLLSGGIAEVIEARHSTRDFSTECVSMTHLSTLLHYAAGVRGYESAYGFKRFPMRMVPSGGGLSPTEVYLASVSVEGLPKGNVYHFNVLRHQLELINADPSCGAAIVEDIARTVPPFFDAKPAFAVVLTSRFGHVEEKYSARGGRFVLLDAGILIESFYLVATGLGIGIVALGGITDELIASALGLRPEIDREAPVVGLLLGHPQAIARSDGNGHRVGVP